MVQKKNILDRFLQLEKVEDIDASAEKRHEAPFLHTLEEYSGQKKVVVPKHEGFNNTCKFFFDKGIEDFNIWSDDKYWVIEFGTNDTNDTKNKGEDSGRNK